jgi:hypothetical protein
MMIPRLQRHSAISSLFAQTQKNLFNDTAFEASEDDFQEAPLLRKGKDSTY